MRKSKLKKPAANGNPVVVRLPDVIVSALDKAAGRNFRTRSQEVRIRLAKSLNMRAPV